MLIRCVLIDHEVAAREALIRYLEKYDFVVCSGDSSSELDTLLRPDDKVDLVILSISHWGDAERATCYWLSSSFNMPLIVATDQTDLTNRVNALEEGADDYVEKPYVHREVVARIRAVLRRTQETRFSCRSVKKYCE